jgi:hypothetical protein
MPTLPTPTTPYYGGGQVQNPANVLKVSGAPSSVLTEDKIGTLAVDNAAGNIYGLASKSGGVNTWILLGGSSGTISAINGTANQITANTVGTVTTLSLPTTLIAPGSLASTTTLGVGTKLLVPTGANASSGTSAAMTAGSVTVANTSVTASSKIFAYPEALGTVTAPQAYYISAIVDATSFTITSADATDTSTWNYWIIN